MSRATRTSCTQEALPATVWPLGTQTVSLVGNACVVHGYTDFDTTDLHSVRSLFPERHVTLDGDVITVWPPTTPPQKPVNQSARIPIS